MSNVKQHLLTIFERRVYKSRREWIKAECEQAAAYAAANRWAALNPGVALDKCPYDPVSLFAKVQSLRDWFTLEVETLAYLSEILQ